MTLNELLAKDLDTANRVMFGILSLDEFAEITSPAKVAAPVLTDAEIAHRRTSKLMGMRGVDYDATYVTMAGTTLPQSTGKNIWDY